MRDLNSKIMVNLANNFCLSLLLLAFSGVACLGRVHQDAKEVMNALAGKDMVATWKSVESFAATLKTNEQVTTLGVCQQHVFAIVTGKVIHVEIDKGTLVPTRTTLTLNQNEVDILLAWVVKCRESGVCGFDLRYLPNYKLIAIYSSARGGANFVVLNDGTPQRYRDMFNADARKGFTPRGDICRKIQDDVFLVTDRR